MFPCLITRINIKKKKNLFTKLIYIAFTGILRIHAGILRIRFPELFHYLQISHDTLHDY